MGASLWTLPWVHSDVSPWLLPEVEFSGLKGLSFQGWAPVLRAPRGAGVHPRLSWEVLDTVLTCGARRSREDSFCRKQEAAPNVATGLCSTGPGAHGVTNALGVSESNTLEPAPEESRGGPGGTGGLAQPEGSAPGA